MTTQSRAENPLRVFLSSRMTEEYQPFRDEIQVRFSANKFIDPWIFEYAPASSEAADEAYLRKVREADLVIWLSGQDSSEPVMKEINEALAHRRRLLVFIIGSHDQDEITKRMLEAVSQQRNPKWKKVTTPEEFGEAVEHAIWDELTRALRSDASFLRSKALERLFRASRARCITRFIASGVTRERALKLVDNHTDLPVLAPAEIPRVGQVTILQGPLGSGKSFVAERTLQSALEIARDSSAPIPVYLTARQAAGNLEADVLSRTSELGDPRMRGATVIIDQVDDVGTGEARDLYQQALALALTWPNTGVLMASRPFPWIAKDSPVLDVKELSIVDAEKLVSVGAAPASEQHALWGLPESLRRTAQRPLFALILGAYLRSHQDRSGLSKGSLIRWMVEQAVGTEIRAPSENTEKMLRQLAVRLTDGSGAVSPRHISISHASLDNLRSTRLVFETDSGFDFALPVLRQWFAYAALEKEEVSIHDLVSMPERLYRWIDVLATAVELAESQMENVLDPIVRKYPAVASLILQTAFGAKSLDDQEAGNFNEQSGTQYLSAMEAWVEGIGPLRKLIAPVDENDQLVSLGFGQIGDNLITSWYAGTEQLPKLVSPPPLFKYSPDWPNVRLSRRGPYPAWAWIDTKVELGTALAHRLKSYDFPLENQIAVHEAAWEFVLSALNRGSLSHVPVAPADLVRLLEGGWPGSIPELRRVSGQALRPIAKFVTGLADQGKYLSPPWPEPDMKDAGRWIWSSYSSDRLLERVRAVFAGAISIYQDVTANWFPTMAERFGTFALMPFSIVGCLIVPPSDDDSWFGPSIDYYFEPLPPNKLSRVDMSLDPISDVKNILERLSAKNQEMRPLAANWTGASFIREILQVYDGRPATAFAFRWLKNDLNRVGWIDGLI